MTQRYNFGPAAPEEETVFGACRPGHRSPSRSPDEAVDDWIAFLRRHDVDRVCCLLDSKLDRYTDLLTQYADAFGPDQVCHAPVLDFHVVSPSTFHETILPFLREADACNERVVVHCSAGCGRTGHVLALWLVTDRDYTLSEAIETVETVEQTDRQPKEAASRAELEDVLQHASGLSS